MHDVVCLEMRALPSAHAADIFVCVQAASVRCAKEKLAVSDEKTR
jgi:hypothetical protein